jgi:hypothetical protein
VDEIEDWGGVAEEGEDFGEAGDVVVIEAENPAGGPGIVLFAGGCVAETEDFGAVGIIGKSFFGGDAEFELAGEFGGEDGERGHFCVSRCRDHTEDWLISPMLRCVLN